MQVKVTADSTCDLMPELQARFDVSMIPLHVVLGDRVLRDGLDIAPAEIFRWSDENRTTPKTSAINLEQAITFLRPFAEAGRDVLFLSISQSMSATYQVMGLAAREYPNIHVEVVDSMNLSLGIGLLALHAAELAQKGTPVGDIAASVRAMVPRIRTSFVVDSTLYLYRGGRCSAVANFAASTLHLKPRISVIDGAMAPTAKYRGKQRAVMDKYLSDLDDELRFADPRWAFIVDTGMEPGVREHVRERLEAYNRFEEIIENPAGSVIASHAGPGTLGVIYAKGE